MKNQAAMLAVPIRNIIEYSSNKRLVRQGVVHPLQAPKSPTSASSSVIGSTGIDEVETTSGDIENVNSSFEIEEIPQKNEEEPVSRKERWAEEPLTIGKFVPPLDLNDDSITPLELSNQSKSAKSAEFEESISIDSAGRIRSERGKLNGTLKSCTLLGNQFSKLFIFLYFLLSFLLSLSSSASQFFPNFLISVLNYFHYSPFLLTPALNQNV